MAAFFITKEDSLIRNAQAIFSQRGFVNGRIYDLSSCKLLFYPKQMLEVHCLKQEYGKSLFCIGTVVYKGYSFDDSLQELLKDLTKGNVCHDELLGEYVLIYDNGSGVSILRDAIGMYKLFTDIRYRFISSSFMAACSCVDERTINDCAVVEQILTGFVSAPDTIVNEVYNITESMQRNIQWVDWLKHPTTKKEQHSKNKQESARVQHNKLKHYMSRVLNLNKEYGCECGMSGGCDSRLIYTSVNECSARMKSVHTHQTSSIHNEEIKVVQDVVKLYDTPLKIVPSVFLPDCDGDEIDKTLKENVMYYDCRNATTIGAMSQTHTREYKRMSSNGNGVTFSGIGGEIYRNFYYTNLPIFSKKRWLENRIFKGIQYMVAPTLYKKSLNNILSKINNIYCVSRFPFGTKQFAKRYFDQYRIPNALCNVVHANNQMSFFLAPFCEQSVISAASKDSFYQDVCGQYEGLIIKQFNNEAANLMTSKGYTLSSLPILTRLLWLRLSLKPDFISLIQYKRKRSKNSMRKDVSNLLMKSNYFSDAYSFFKSKYSDWDFSVFEKNNMTINSFVFSVCAIFEINNING